MRQLLTIVAQDGPNHLGLWSDSAEEGSPALTRLLVAHAAAFPLREALCKARGRGRVNHPLLHHAQCSWIGVEFTVGVEKFDALERVV